jgi:hypothetical protein
MKEKSKNHLNEDQTICSVLDESVLSPELKTHMASCGLCADSKRKLEKDLKQLGDNARSFAPSMEQKTALPLEKSGEKSEFFSFGHFNKSPALSLAATAVILITIVWWSPVFKFDPVSKSDNGLKTGEADQEIWEADELLTEISRLSENSLPVVYMDISGESYLGLEEEFIDFVAPSITNGPLTIKQRGKGESLC